MVLVGLTGDKELNMPSFTYNATIPAANNSPADDQSIMLQNTSSISGLVSQDHVGFNTANGGQHLQVSLPGNNTAGPQTGLASTIYSGPGTAKPSTSQLFYRNGDVPYQVSCVRAWGFCNSGGVISSQSYNVSTVTRSSAGNYVVTLSANAVNSANFAVLVSANINTLVTSGSIPGYVITGTGTFQLNFRALSGAFAVDPDSFSFTVLQI